MQTMFTNEDTIQSLAALGVRLRTARIDKGDSQALFAQRLGVSIPTLRDMETGSATVAIGTWVAALWMLSRLADIDHVLVQQESLFRRVEKAAQPRRRAPRRRST